MKARHALAVIAALALLLAACGDDDAGDSSLDETTRTVAAPGGEDGCEEMTPIKFGGLPAPSSAATLLGIEMEFFEDECIHATFEILTDPSASVAALIAGDYDFIGSAATSVALARSGGNEIGLAAAQIATSESAFRTFTNADSGIETYADLEGATMTYLPRTFVELTTRLALREAGVDDSTVTFQVLPPQNWLEAARQDQVDATSFVAPPFLTQGLASPDLAVVEGDQFIWGDYGTSYTYFVTSDAFARENPEVMEHFYDAIQRINHYANENPDEANTQLAGLYDIPVEEARAFPNQTFGGERSLESLQKELDASVELGWYEAIDPEDIIIDGSPLFRE